MVVKETVTESVIFVLETVIEFVLFDGLFKLKNPHADYFYEVKKASGPVEISLCRI